ncbi:hypothetical protein BT63DRAFT_408238 [Microthyrium microscopicum]|uniref:Uncharacterized protein n=1 Tax=Microthyrium microscopicum TaxID=703497 RepID=A0A6A6URC5_9PEZI|nr:hypothetical protein BT63DRAFT_408238 [Microthyrium microscopicum]
MASSIGFFDLPAELRLEIYKVYLDDCGSYTPENDEEKDGKDCKHIRKVIPDFFDEAKDLLLLNRQICNEAWHIISRIVHNQEAPILFHWDTDDFHTFKRAFESVSVEQRSSFVEGKLMLVNTPLTPDRFPIKELVSILGEETSDRSICFIEAYGRERWVREWMVDGFHFEVDEEDKRLLSFSVHFTRGEGWEYFEFEGMPNWLDCIDQILRMEH